ncbi:MULTISPECIES: response regulator transcription factor [Cupriavidus]|uniref:response regulator transcription factor n=1 Tax=Cupriavidus TaxID=106589 RepID=UPI0007E3B266|nr:MULTISPECIES: response regulator transcription factor [Cupriavidus]MCD9123229.1 response regulator transcription factor [Cupriavidus sp. UGS-1]
MRIAALQDDPTQAVVLEQTLSLQGHRCIRFREGRTLMMALRQEAFDMLLLDWEVPGIAAQDVLLWVRRTIGSRLPVMLLGDAAEECQLCHGLAQGADAFITKPVRRAELAARIHALARRMLDTGEGCFDLSVGAYRFSTTDRRAYLTGTPVMLSPKEFDLAILLFRHLGQLVLRQTMIDEVWHRALPAGSRTLDSHLSRVRTKLALWPHNGVRLTTVYSAGCRLDVVDPI